MPVEPFAPATARGAARIAKQLEVALCDQQLSLAQYRLLAYLAGGPERARQLAEWLAVSPPTLTALVDGVVARALVARVAIEGDRRGVRHELTDEGRATLAAAEEAIQARLEWLAGYLSSSESRRAFEGLALWNKAMEAAAVDKAAERAAEKLADKDKAAKADKADRSGRVAARAAAGATVR